MTIDTAWSHRWMYSLEPAIMQSRKKIEKQVRNNKKIEPRTRDALTTIATTMEGLRRFAAGQTRLFADLFSGKPSVLIPDPFKYPKEWVMRSTLDQIAFDLEVLLRAANQRLESISGPASAQTLQLADQYAYHHVLRPAIDAEFIKETTVITYFQKNPSVRVIPYAPVALIGIPYTTLNVTRQATTLGTQPNLQSLGIFDFGAIAHEIGHYVYRHGVVPGENISIHKACNNIKEDEEGNETDDMSQKKPKSKKSKTISRKSIDELSKHREAFKNVINDIFANPELEVKTLGIFSKDENSIVTIKDVTLLAADLQNAYMSQLGKWIQEIFADIFGCLIAGPSIAFAFIELQIDNNLKNIASDDDEHPPTIIRPLIYLQILEAIGYGKDAAILNTLWHDWLSQRGIDQPRKSVCDEIKKFVTTMIEELNLNKLETVYSGKNTQEPQELPSTVALNEMVEEEVEKEIIKLQSQGKDVTGVGDLSIDFPLEIKIRILNKSAKELLQNDLGQIIRVWHRMTPKLALINDCIHGRRCQWALFVNDFQIRYGEFWRGGPGSTTVIPGTFIGPTTAPGIKALVHHAQHPNEKIEACIWKDIFLMNGWATGGPEEDGSN